jgi:hypothetical protein
MFLKILGLIGLVVEVFSINGMSPNIINLLNSRQLHPRQSSTLLLVVILISLSQLIRTQRLKLLYTSQTITRELITILESLF